LDVLANMRLVDYGDAAIPERANREGTVDLILEAQAAVESKVNDVLEAGAVPIVIGQNSPCGSYAIAKPLSEGTKGAVGMVSLDTHWDAQKIDRYPTDPRIAGAGKWKDSVYRDLKNFPSAQPCGDRQTGDARVSGDCTTIPGGWCKLRFLLAFTNRAWN
jgi:agmatinase